MAKHISIILGAVLIAGAIIGAALLIGRGGGALAAWHAPSSTNGTTPTTGTEPPVKGPPVRPAGRSPVVDSPSEAEFVGRWKCGPVTAEYCGDGRVSFELDGAQQQLDALTRISGLPAVDGRGWAPYSYEAGVLTVILADVPHTGHVVWLKKPNELLVNCSDEEDRPISERWVRVSPPDDAEPGPPHHAAPEPPTSHQD